MIKAEVQTKHSTHREPEAVLKTVTATEMPAFSRQLAAGQELYCAFLCSASSHPCQHPSCAWTAQERLCVSQGPHSCHFICRHGQGSISHTTPNGHIAKQNSHPPQHQAAPLCPAAVTHHIHPETGQVAWSSGSSGPQPP